ncbi:hypothetical protein [Aureibacter tunicatorum]|uniref:Uncharacterized protein n=1 Tax=Aureibacter tunicatorum TaxID=866807 RepID=A0AAE3XQS4_9BACT|nr:hypothetical protein [Aureibacter tunicatorum]MDR6239689.1 hypothetical protein [Aureibacter tunicatorum]BDD04165.1 hypothetical protein AUTU_16480 [Aureibacter tunicatorum]
MKIYKALLVFVFTLLFHMSKGQDLFPSEVWHDGELVLMTGDTLRAPLKYDFSNESVLLNHKGTVLSYSARKILYFEIFDVVSDRYREFFALPFFVRQNYKAPILFEVITEGSLTLLAREYIMVESTPATGMYGQPIYVEPVRRLVHDYYFLNMDGEIELFSMRKRELYQVMSRRLPDVKKYIKRNKLHISNPEDLIRIVIFYNELMEGNFQHANGR